MRLRATDVLPAAGTLDVHPPEHKIQPVLTTSVTRARCPRNELEIRHTCSVFSSSLRALAASDSDDTLRRAKVVYRVPCRRTVSGVGTRGVCRAGLRGQIHSVDASLARLGERRLDDRAPPRSDCLSTLRRVISATRPPRVPPRCLPSGPHHCWPRIGGSRNAGTPVA